MATPAAAGDAPPATLAENAVEVQADEVKGVKINSTAEDGGGEGVAEAPVASAETAVKTEDTAAAAPLEQHAAGEILADNTTYIKKKRGKPYSRTPSTRFMPFEEARALIRGKGLSSQEQWIEWCKNGNRPANIPSNPDRSYKTQGWVSWPDWLGYGVGQAARSYSSEFRPFEEARAFAREQGLKGQKQWYEWCRQGKRPSDIPSTPDTTYRDKGWQSWPDWLGYVTRVGQSHREVEYREFTAARAYMHKQRLEGRHHWDDWCRMGRRPDDMPLAPHEAYMNKGWVSWQDWLGYSFVSYEEARREVHTLGLDCREAWRDWCRFSGQRPLHIPTAPDRYYRTEWESWQHWLGLEVRGQQQ